MAYLMKLSPQLAAHDAAKAMLSSQASQKATALQLGLDPAEVQAALQHLAAKAPPKPAPKAKPKHDPDKLQAAVASKLGDMGLAPGDVPDHSAVPTGIAKKLQAEFPGLTKEDVTAAIQGAGGAKPAAPKAAAAAPAKLPHQRQGPRNVPNAALPDVARPHLTRAEAEAAEGYSFSHYRELNKALRDGRTPKGELGPVHEGLRTAFAKAKPFDQPVKVRRGMQLTNDEGQKFIDALKAGQAQDGAARLPGYTSTTTKPKGFEGNIQLTIHATHGLDLKPYSELANEDELLLDHNSAFRVKKITDTADGWHVELEQIPPGLEPQAEPAKLQGWWQKLKSKVTGG